MMVIVAFVLIVGVIILTVVMIMIMMVKLPVIYTLYLPTSGPQWLLPGTTES